VSLGQNGAPASERRFDGIRGGLGALGLEAGEACPQFCDFRMQLRQIVLHRVARHLVDPRRQLRDLIALKLGQLAELFAEDILEELFKILSHSGYEASKASATESDEGREGESPILTSEFVLL
ncbi:MAG: hypothetical protein WA208_13515, partial [Thermoanaerobaculia bacterium]